MAARTSKLIPFPQLDLDRSDGPDSEAEALHEECIVRHAQLPHRGLRLMAPGTTVAMAARESRQAQADSIVAQVEWEIEQQAARQREKNVLRMAPAQEAEAFSQVETPASVGRRLFAALFSSARTA